jgi:hypothetical protein
LGQSATDYDFIRFQKSVNANVKGGARVRHEILLRKAFIYDSEIANAFDTATISSSGIKARVKELGESIGIQIGRVNSVYASKYGEDLFKATNKTSQALLRLGKPINELGAYKSHIADLYYVFREGVGQRLDGHLPQSFSDINALRTDLQHDVDHGEKGKIAAKRKKLGAVFAKYGGVGSPDVLEPSRFIIVQANLLAALESDLRNLAL